MLLKPGAPPPANRPMDSMFLPAQNPGRYHFGHNQAFDALLLLYDDPCFIYLDGLGRICEAQTIFEAPCRGESGYTPTIDTLLK
jgi:hypothetical protein